MKMFPRLALTAGLLSAPLLHARDFTTFLPADVSMVFGTRDLQEQKELWNETTFGASLKEVDWKFIFTTLIAEDIENEAEFNNATEKISTQLQQFTEQLNGSAVLATGNIGELVKQIMLIEDDSTDFDEMTEAEEAAMLAFANLFVFLADVDDADEVNRILREAVDSLLQLDEEEIIVKVEEDDIEGLDAIEDEEKLGFGFYWAIENDLLVIGFTRDRVLSQLDALTSPPMNPLAASDSYLLAQERMLEDYHSFWYADLAQIINVLFEAVGSVSEPEEMEIINRIESWVSADSFLPLMQSTRLRATGLDSRLIFGFKNECGLQRLFMEPTGENVITPAFMHKDFGSVTTLNWSLAEFMNILEAELPKISPEGAAAFGMGRMMAAGQLGFDPKLQLLDHLDSGIVVAQVFDAEFFDKLLDPAIQEDPEAFQQLMAENPTEGEYTLMGFQVKNEQAIRTVIETLTAKFMEVDLSEPQDYRGQDIYQPLAGMGLGPAMEKMFAYTFLDNYLLISVGDNTLLHMAVDAMKDPGMRVWETEEFTTLFSQSPAEVQMLEYTSSAMIDTALEMIRGGLTMAMLAEFEPSVQDAIMHEFEKISFGESGRISTNASDGLVTEVNVITGNEH